MIELNATEAEAVARVLEEYIPKLRVEIHRTEWNHELRHQMELEEAVLTTLFDRLAARPGPSPAP